MMQTFKQFVAESINDKGLFKALFVVGLPGAGKSYTTRSLMGDVQPRVVNTDQAAEFMARKLGRRVTSKDWEAVFKESSLRITSERLTQYLNGMLPLVIDGTSNDTSNTLHRIGILKSLGYDIGMVHVTCDIGTALKRVQIRGINTPREVDEDFVKRVSDVIAANTNYLKGEVSFYREFQNNGSLDNEALNELFKKSQSFFTSPLKNPLGQRHLDELKSHPSNKYLTPTIMSAEVLAKKANGWYKS